MRISPAMTTTTACYQQLYESMNMQGERSRDPIVMTRCAGFEFQKEEPILSLWQIFCILLGCLLA